MAERGQALCVSSYKGTNPITKAPPSWSHITWITSQRLQIPSRLGLGFQHTDWGEGHKHLIHNKCQVGGLCPIVIYWNIWYSFLDSSLYTCHAVTGSFLLKTRFSFSQWVSDPRFGQVWELARSVIFYWDVFFWWYKLSGILVDCPSLFPLKSHVPVTTSITLYLTVSNSLLKVVTKACLIQSYAQVSLIKHFQNTVPRVLSKLLPGHAGEILQPLWDTVFFPCWSKLATLLYLYCDKSLEVGHTGRVWPWPRQFSCCSGCLPTHS